MPQYRFNGRIKAIKFADSRVSVLLENTTFLSNEGDWKQWVDWQLIETGKYRKGEVWVSAFEQSAPEVFQSCKIIEKGSEVEVDIFKTEKGFLNINNIRMKVPEVDVLEDAPGMPDDAPYPSAQEEMAYKEAIPPKEKSTTLDMPDKDLSIIRQCCIKAASRVLWAETDVAIVAIAKRLEKYVLEGK